MLTDLFRTPIREIIFDHWLLFEIREVLRSPILCVCPKPENKEMFSAVL